MQYTRILIVEDNDIIAEQLCDYLSDQGFVVDYADTGKRALALFQQTAFDVVILDLMLPDMDGTSLCAELKQTSRVNVPVLMLTARDSVAEKGQGFAAGADDYLTKPFELAEVAMRCTALSRRHRLHQPAILVIEDLSVNLRDHTVTRAGQSIQLSATDFAILSILAESYPAAISRNELAAKIWGDDMPDSDALRSHIYTLRKAVDKPFATPIIKTIQGVGFKLASHTESRANESKA